MEITSLLKENCYALGSQKNGAATASFKAAFDALDRSPDDTSRAALLRRVSAARGIPYT
jgi:hypothetical protein